MTHCQAEISWNESDLSQNLLQGRKQKKMRGIPSGQGAVGRGIPRRSAFEPLKKFQGFSNSVI